MPRPSLVIVSGPPGSGKTTLAHEIARRIPCPAIGRDEIKEGIVHAEGGWKPVWGGPVTQRTFDTFFDVVHLLLSRGVTIVIEAAFQHAVWEPKVRPLLEIADARIVHCEVDPAIARERIERRLAEHAGRSAHNDAEFLAAVDRGEASFSEFDPLRLEVPRIVVDTTDGYTPRLDEIVTFAR